MIAPKTTSSKKSKGLFSIIALLTLAFFSYKMLMLTLPYTSGKWDIDFLRTKQDIVATDYWRYAFYIHIFSAIFVLIAGATQFSAWILRQYPVVHRWIGKLYVINILVITGPAALIMAFHSNGGLWAHISFVLLSILWWFFTLQAYLSIRKKQLIRHGDFMLRSYALTLSAITLRIYMVLFGHFEMDPIVRYTLIGWLSWTINLGLAELLIYLGFSKRLIEKMRRASRHPSS